MVRLLLPVLLVGCAAPQPHQIHGDPDAPSSNACVTTILAPQPELRYATDLIATVDVDWRSTPEADRGFFAVVVNDDQGREYEWSSTTSSTTASGATEFQWSFQLPPSRRCVLVLDGGEWCQASVEFFTSP